MVGGLDLAQDCPASSCPVRVVGCVVTTNGGPPHSVFDSLWGWWVAGHSLHINFEGHCSYWLMVSGGFNTVMIVEYGV